MTLVQLNRDTGEVFDLPGNDLRLENITLREELARLRESLNIELEAKRQLHRQNQALLKERNDSRALDPHKPLCDRVFEKWRAYVRPKAREFDEKRYSAVRARRNGGYSDEECLRVIDGAVNMPAHIKGHRRDLMLELEYMFRNAQHVDMFLGWAGVEQDPDWVLAFRGQGGTRVPAQPDVMPTTGFCAVCGFFAYIGVDGLLSCERECSHEAQVEALLGGVVA